MASDSAEEIPEASKKKGNLDCSVCGKSFGRRQHLRRHENRHLFPLQFHCDVKGCRKQFSTVEELQEHKENHTITTQRLLKCEMCDKTFKTAQGLEIHVVGNHVVDKEFKCKVCLKGFVTNTDLEVHLGKSHKGGTAHRVFCDLCPMGYSNMRFLMGHLQRVHSRTQRCALCKKTFVNQEEMDVHCATSLKEIGGSTKHACTECSITYGSKCLLDQHTLAAHPETRKVKVSFYGTQAPGQEEFGEFKCTHCDATFNRKSHLLSHERCVHQGAEWTCKFCSKVFDRKCEMTSHEEDVHGSKEYKCDICSKAFMWRRSLREHRKLHENPNAYRCQVCAKAYTSRASFYKHIKSHKEGKTYKCNKCSETFLLPGGLRNHMGKAHARSNKSFKCPMCPATFGTRRYLEQKHIPTHSDDRPLITCDHCPMTFKSLSMLTLHKNKLKEFSFVVTSTKKAGAEIADSQSESEELDDKYGEYDCRKCDTSFERRLDLVSHEKIKHASFEKACGHIDKCFKCPQCPAMFSKQSSLRNHKATAHGETKRPYQCQICPAKFSRHDYLLKVHMPSHTDLDDWPFACETCPRRFKGKNALSKHTCSIDNISASNE